jgi:signal transduction histidine kinase
MVSHELKLPIVNMRNAVKRLKTKDADVVEVSKLEAHLNNMDGLIEAMLLLSRIEREKLNYGEVNTQTLVEDILSEVDLPAATTVAYNNLPTIRADVYLLRQLFVNLIQNAIKFSGKQPEPAIEISAELTTNKYIFSIKDNGVGFDSGKTGHLFGLFHRLHFASDFVGFGVGLVIAKTIVERHGGRIWGNGELNKGAVFHFEIPKQ